MSNDIKALKVARAKLITPAVKAMNGEDYRELRDSYYKAVEGLMGLKEALEALMVIAPAGTERDAVRFELEGVEVAEGAMSQSCLGRIL